MYEIVFLIYVFLNNVSLIILEIFVEYEIVSKYSF